MSSHASSLSSKPFITVCIITLNRERVIREALRSLISQDYPKDRLHVVVVDGGSTDNTVEVCRSLLSQAGFSGYEIIVKPSTIPEARNICLTRARGEFVFFWDSDIIMKPCALTQLVDSAVKTGADIVSASVSFIEVKYPEEGWTELNRVLNNVDEGLIEVPAVTMSATLIKRRVWEKVHFDNDLTLYEDADFCWRARNLGFRIFLHGGVRAFDLNLADDPKSDIFTSKPLRELMRGLIKKGKAKAFCLDIRPNAISFIKYILRNPRHTFYLGYLFVLPLLILSAVYSNLFLTLIALSYILGYAAVQVMRRGVRLGMKVFISSFLVGLPINVVMLYYSVSGSFFQLIEAVRRRGNKAVENHVT